MLVNYEEEEKKRDITTTFTVPSGPPKFEYKEVEIPKISEDEDPDQHFIEVQRHILGEEEEEFSEDIEEEIAISKMEQKVKQMWNEVGIKNK